MNLRRTLRLCAAWVAMAYIRFLWKWALPAIINVHPVLLLGLMHERGIRVVAGFSSGLWQVKIDNHHYSVSPSLRRALVAALKKLNRAQPPPSRELSPEE